ncbi:MAG: 2-oxoacid:acceptor oxidoreductase subunit alpha [Polyangiaceae bacterium]|nr:2-oxoacid:acceptor oxidoreductase subunit alpha [Polyangiaceae bacterium]
MTTQSPLSPTGAGAPAGGPLPTQPKNRSVAERESVVIRFCGDSGDGMQLTGTEFTRVTALAGNDLSTLPDFPAEIRAPAGSIAGVSGYQLQFSSREVFTPGDQPHTLVAMNPAALKANLADLVPGGALVVNTGAFTKPNLQKAGYESNPLEDGSLARYHVHQVDVTKLTALALKDTGLSSKEIGRCKNFFALGLAFWMYNRPTEPEIESIKQKFGKKPELADANIKAFLAGYNYGETAEIFTESIEVKPAPIAAGTYRNIMGNSATAIGLVTAGHLSGLDIFFAGYPITPASSILHELSNYRAYGVTTFQCEDEIAAIGAALGGSFGGQLGVTASSGPGIALKGEFLGLAVSLELPLVIINVQRGGPSTGLPTKTEQADLLQALYGRNGECPIPVLAAMTPADCFDATIEACRVAVKHMTPVLLLTDGYLANGSEPWLLPKKSDLAPIEVKFRTDPTGYEVYERDPETLARAWVRPGTPGLAHRVGGLEKDALTGNVSYDPVNHEVMCQTRADKVARVAQGFGKLHLTGPDHGELLVCGWGSTYGAIAQSVELARAEGRQVSHVHLRWLNPLHRELGALLKRFDKVLVPEMNLGQLVKVLRAEFLVDAQSFTKVQGKPFTVSELKARIDQLTSQKERS